MHTQFRRAESKETKFMIFELQQVQDVQIVIFKCVGNYQHIVRVKETIFLQ